MDETCFYMTVVYRCIPFGLKKKMQRLLQFFEGKIAYFIHLFRNKIEIYGFCNYTVFYTDSL